MALTGDLILGGRRAATGDTFTARSSETGEALETEFSQAGPEQVEEACALAAAASEPYGATSPDERAAFLEAIAEEIEALGDPLIERAMAESGLPQARLQGERGRTCGQLRLFAQVVRRGDWLGLRLDTPLPDREPLPRPDLRQRKIALGPVAVFGASNFPLAFSVAGGDTASALAAGCPVVVKGHPAHPGTSEMVGSAIAEAAEKTGMPEGVFSLLQGDAALGATLVSDPRIMAVGFTGSRKGGLAIRDAAAKRNVPIPVYAEMSSVNPVLLMPGALSAKAQELGQQFVASLVLGAGQFCTNPGIILAVEGRDLDSFVEAARDALEQATPQVMLTDAICKAYHDAVEALVGRDDVELIARGPQSDAPNRGQAALFTVPGDLFLQDESLADEMFGAAGIVVRCRDVDQFREVLEGMEGQLTATLHLTEEDHEAAAALMPLLERRAGRILAGGWPTGVEVSDAMVHGGPFPATTDSRTTSVGTLAIDRFLRPVCYQSLPEALLPPALRDGNPYGAPRLVDGKWER